MTPPKPSKEAEKRYPAPDRADYTSGEAYAEACRRCSENRIEFDCGSGADLTPKQERFALEYFRTGNATAAYRAAYDTENMVPNSIWNCASTLLNNPKVAQRIAELRKRAAQTVMMEAEEVLREAMRLARFDVRRLYRADGSPIPIHELDDDTAAAVQAVDIHEEYAGSGADRVFVGYTKKYKIADKNSALEKLFKHYGLFLEDNKQKNDVLNDFLDRCAGRGIGPTLKQGGDAS